MIIGSNSRECKRKKGVLARSVQSKRDSPSSAQGPSRTLFRVLHPCRLFPLRSIPGSVLLHFYPRVRRHRGSSSCCCRRIRVEGRYVDPHVTRARKGLIAKWANVGLPLLVNRADVSSEIAPESEGLLAVRARPEPRLLVDLEVRPPRALIPVGIRPKGRRSIVGRARVVSCDRCCRKLSRGWMTKFGAQKY